MDVVVTVPLSFGWGRWLDEGDLPGEPWSKAESYFWIGRSKPDINPGERVYIVHNGKLRGYAPLVRLHRSDLGTYALVRRGGAVSCTLPEGIKGFRGFRYRWWGRGDELPFPDWRTP